MKKIIFLIAVGMILTGCNPVPSPISSTTKSVFMNGQNGIDYGEIIESLVCTNNKTFIHVKFSNGWIGWYSPDDTNILGYVNKIQAENSK